MPSPGSIVRFGIFQLDVQTGELHRSGVPVKLHGQPIQILTILLEHPGALVTREELRERLWSGHTFIDFEHSLNSAVKRLREALSDSADEPRFIETLPRKGYRFIATPELLPEAETAVEAVETQQPRRRSSYYRALLAGLATICLVGVVYLLWETARAVPPRSQPLAVIAVLPFVNLASPDDSYLADALTEEIRNHLARSQPDRLQVVGRSSVMQYKNTDRSVKQIGQELGADYVLEGSMRREGNRARISAQLIQVSSQVYVWGMTYDGDVARTLELQKTVAQEIEDGVVVALNRTRHHP